MSSFLVILLLHYNVRTI